MFLSMSDWGTGGGTAVALVVCMLSEVRPPAGE